MAGFESFSIPCPRGIRYTSPCSYDAHDSRARQALEPIDMESYDMESPELTAERTINKEFSTTEIILGFALA